MLLSACGTVSSDLAAPPPVVKTRCPPIVNYSSEKQKKFAEELQALPKDSALAGVIVDYSKLRDSCRAINRSVKD